MVFNLKQIQMKKITLKKTALLSIIVLSFIACDSHDGQKVDSKYTTLVWNDEFDGAIGDLPDFEKWSYDLGTGDHGWGNNELQTYTNDPENISQDGNGNLVITAIKNGSSYTSARIKTKGILEQQYGRFEARIQTPYGQGLWPAFWMLGNDSDTNTWPKCGEIDIMELRGQKPNVVQSSLHGPGYFGSNPITDTYTLINNRFDTGFHIFAVDWDENKIDFYVDGYLYQRVNKSDVDNKVVYGVPKVWAFDHPFYLILNLAVGGNFLGNPNTSTSFPQKMTIDYVRVYH